MLDMAMGLRCLRLSTKVLNQNTTFETHSVNPRVMKNTALEKSEQHWEHVVKAALWWEWAVWEFSGVFHTGKINLKLKLAKLVLHKLTQHSRFLLVFGILISMSQKSKKVNIIFNLYSLIVCTRGSCNMCFGM